MENKHAHPARLGSTTGAGFTCLGVFVLLGDLDWAVGQLGNLFCGAASEALGVLPCVVLTVCEATQAYVFDHHWLFGLLFEILRSSCPLLKLVGVTI